MRPRRPERRGVAVSPRPEGGPPAPDLRVARVVEAREHPDADRLIVLRVDLGDEERQIVAGLVGHYAPAELEDLDLVVVANLKPATLRGELSEGMLLAAEDGEGNLGVLLAEGAEPGTRLAPTGAGEPADEITFDEFHENALLARPGEVTLNGEPLLGADLRMDREVHGRLR